MSWITLPPLAQFAYTKIVKIRMSSRYPHSRAFSSPVYFPTNPLATILVGEITMAKLKRAVGNYVTGEKFWDREQDIKILLPGSS
jgi:hypothetical protein